MRYWWQSGVAVAMNRAATTHLHMLTHKHALTHVNTCTRNGGLIERVWTQPAVHTGMCLTAVTDSPNSAEEKNTHQHSKAQKRPKYTPWHVLSTVCQTSQETHALMQKAHRYTYSFCSVAQACTWYISNKSKQEEFSFLGLTNFSVVTTTWLD